MTMAAPDPRATAQIFRLVVNGRTHLVSAPGATPLVDVVRDQLDLRGTKSSCGVGRCGACTVRLGDRAVASCLLPVALAEDDPITTVEGLADGDRLSPVQQAFGECHALQCGFCTPGFLTTVTAGLAENPAPSRPEAVAMIAGNLCRCTGYHNIVDAVLRAAELGREGS